MTKERFIQLCQPLNEECKKENFQALFILAIDENGNVYHFGGSQIPEDTYKKMLNTFIEKSKFPSP